MPALTKRKTVRLAGGPGKPSSSKLLQIGESSSSLTGIRLLQRQALLSSFMPSPVREATRKECKSTWPGQEDLLCAALHPAG